MRIECEPVTSLNAGIAVLRVTSVNDGDETVSWPVRLHPSESTIAFMIDGTRCVGVEQIDSIVSTVQVPPGQALSTGVALRVDEITPGPDSLLDAGSGGTIDVQVVVSPPGAYGEVASNHCELRAAEQSADGDAGETGAGLGGLDAAAWAAREGAEATDDDATDAFEQALGEIDPGDRAWIATALLPAAPFADDVLLVAARRLEESQDDTDAVAVAVLEGVPHAPDR